MNIFRSKSKSDNRIETLIGVLENASHESSMGFLDYLKKKNGDNEKTVYLYNMIFFEFLFFYIHQVNRTAFEILGPEARSKLLDFILPRLIDKSLKDLFNGVNDENKKLFYKEYNNAELEYSRSNVLILPSDQKGPSMITSLAFRIIEVIKGSVDLEVEELPNILRLVGDAVIEQMKKYFSDKKMDTFIKDIYIPN